MEDKFKDAAEYVVREMGPIGEVKLEYNRESVEALEGYIERLRETDNLREETVRQNCVALFGSFLGECIIKCYGGRWMERDGSWGVVLGEKLLVFPFGKVVKQMENGREAGDGIAGFFKMLPKVFEHQYGIPLKLPEANDE